MLRIAVCDDMEADRAALVQMLLSGLAERNESLPKIYQYVGGEEMLADIEEGYESFDWIFLDIYMNGLSGMDTARRLRKMAVKSTLVFLTTTPDFAVESYDVDATGYLLKPLGKETLDGLLGKLLEHCERPRVCLQCGWGRRYFFCDEISYVESSGHTVHLHMTNGVTFSYKDKLNNVERALSDQRFLRCHQSFLVNMDRIVDTDGDFILKDGARVPIRVRSHREITDRYYQYFISRTIARVPEAMEEQRV